MRRPPCSRHTPRQKVGPKAPTPQPSLACAIADVTDVVRVHLLLVSIAAAPKHVEERVALFECCLLEVCAALRCSKGRGRGQDCASASVEQRWVVKRWEGRELEIPRRRQCRSKGADSRTGPSVSMITTLPPRNIEKPKILASSTCTLRACAASGARKRYCRASSSAVRIARNTVCDGNNGKRGSVRASAAACERSHAETTASRDSTLLWCPTKHQCTLRQLAHSVIAGVEPRSVWR